MADIAFTCPQCGHAYQFATHLGGKRGRCKSCQAVFRIPDAAAGAAPPPATAVAPRPAASSPPADNEVKIAFQCPSCGRGYRLDAKLAGKQGRCTSCRGTFTIPSTSSRGPSPASTRPQTRPDAPRSSPPAVRGASARPPVPAPVAAAGDSGWWELDSSESIPATTARGAAHRRRAATAVAAAPVVEPGEWTEVEDDAPVAVSRPVPAERPKWVIPASIAGAVVAGGIAFAITMALVSGARRPPSPSVAEQPREEAEPTPPPAKVADADAAESSPSPAPRPAEAGSNHPPAPRRVDAAEQHRETVDALIRAYNRIADGYARIHDPASIPVGYATISGAVAELRTASRRGKGLPPLPPPQRQALIRETGPSLLQAIDRILGELRRLQATPGLRSEFGLLIDAYTRTREGIRREVDQA